MQNINGWDFELWADGGTGTMTINNNGTFSAVWDGRTDKNILFRSGRKFGTAQGVNRTHKEIGEITMTFDATHQPLNQNSMLCVYGWTARQTMEYYIIESWGSYQKGRQGACTQSHDHVVANCRRPYLVTTYTIPNEGTYELYVSHERVNQPSIFSNNDTFPQYMAIRTAASGRRTSGTISVSEHFRRWEAAGLTHMGGSLYEVSFCVEAWGSAGSAAVNALTLDIGEYKGDGNGGTDPKPDVKDIIIPAAQLRASSSIGTGSINIADNAATITYGDQAYGNVYAYFDVTFPAGINISDYKSIDFDFQFLGGDLGDGKRLFVLAAPPSGLTGFKPDAEIGAWDVDNPTLGITSFSTINTLMLRSFKENLLPARTAALSGNQTVRFAFYIPAEASGNDGGTDVATRYRISNIVLRALNDECECTPGAADCTVCKDCGEPLEGAAHKQNPDNCRKCADCEYVFETTPCGICPVCLCKHESYGWVNNKCRVSWACTLCGKSEWNTWICSYEQIRSGCMLRHRCINTGGCGYDVEFKRCHDNTIDWTDDLSGTCTVCNEKWQRYCWGTEDKECKYEWDSDECGSYGECTVCGAGHRRPCDPGETISDGCGRSSTCKLCGMKDSWLACYDVNWNWEVKYGICFGTGVCTVCDEEWFSDCFDRDTVERDEETGISSCTACKRVVYRYIENSACTTHDFGDWVITLAATRTAEGERERICKACGNKETGTIARLRSSGGGGGGGGGGSANPPDLTPAPSVTPAPFAIPAATINAIAGTRPFVQLRAANTGRQPVDTGSADNAGQNAILVRMNADGELEVITSTVIGANGIADINITQTGDFIVLVRKTGDITGTGEVETADALALLRHVAGISALDAVQLFVANGKAGDVNTTDALNILKTVAGL
jgi:hypothetical protein